MSKDAQVWVSRLPLDCGLNLAAFRVLDKLADAHHVDTGMAYRFVDQMARELRCSKRTVQRALKDLQLLGFLRPGDQRILGHLDARHRPQVWQLALELWVPTSEEVELDGMTSAVTPSQAVDNFGSGVTGTASPLTKSGVTDTPGLGVTSAVAHRTGSRTSNNYPAQPQSAGACSHDFGWVSDAIGLPAGEFCRRCGLRRDGRVRIEADGAVRPVRRTA